MKCGADDGVIRQWGLSDGKVMGQVNNLYGSVPAVCSSYQYDCIAASVGSSIVLMQPDTYNAESEVS